MKREWLLQKLELVVQTLQKKFKQDIATVLDDIRFESIRVIDALLRWRYCVCDHRAALIWNNGNYLMKMVSDLDNLQYIPIIREKYRNRNLLRNPFLVTRALDKVFVTSGK